MTAPSSPETTVVCYVRAPLLLEPIDRKVETLRACEAEGTVDDVLLRSWPKEVSRSGAGPDQEVLDVVERFDRWAAERGVSVRPPFKERTVTSQVTGETRDLLLTPMLCLAVHVDGELAGVFPHSSDEDTYTAGDAIAELRTGEVPEPLGSPPTPADRTDGLHCPECGGGLVDGQGLFACPECAWMGTLGSEGIVEQRKREDADEWRERSEPLEN